MKKTILITSLLLLLCFIGFGQNKSNEIKKELKLKIEKERDSTLKGKLFHKLGIEYFYSNKDSSFYALNRAEKLLKKTKKVEAIHIKNYQTIAGLYSDFNQFEASDSVYNLSLEYSKKFKIDFNYNELIAKRSIAMNLYKRGRIKEAITYYKKFEDKILVFDTIPSKNLLLYWNIIQDKAILYAEDGKLDVALTYFIKNYNYKKNRINKKDVITVENFINAGRNLALCYDYLNKPKKAIEIILTNIEIGKKFKIKNSLKPLYANLGLLFEKSGQYQKAISFTIKSLGTSKREDALSYNNLGNFYLSIDSLKKSKNYYFKGLRLYTELDNNKGIALVHRNLGEYFFNLDEFVTSKNHLQTALEIYKKLKINRYILMTKEILGRCMLKLNKIKEAKKLFLDIEKYLEEKRTHDYFYVENKNNLYKTYKINNNYSKALFWHEAFLMASEKWDSIRRNKEFFDLTVKYETQQKENEILKLKTETQQKELDLQKSKTKTNYALASIFLVVLGGGFYLRKRKKDQQLKLLEESVKSVEQEKNRIGRELHDSVASSLRRLAHDTKNKDITLSHKLLNSYESLRDLSHQLNNTPAHGELFMDSILELMPKNNDNQQFNLKIEPPYLELTEPHSTHLYRIIQELFTNNLKHANASKTSISIVLKDNLLVMNYTDDGVGASNLKKGTGIKSIQDRITLLKGTIDINSNDGFNVNIKIPYNA